jgi:hypothetical protein
VAWAVGSLNSNELDYHECQEHSSSDANHGDVRRKLPDLSRAFLRLALGFCKGGGGFFSLALSRSATARSKFRKSWRQPSICLPLQNCSNRLLHMQERLVTKLFHSTMGTPRLCIEQETLNETSCSRFGLGLSQI